MNSSPGLLLLNARSLASKIPLLQVYASNYKPFFIAITETWATAEIPDSVYNLDGYRLFRKDRNGRQGGGVCLYVTSQVKSAVESSLNDRSEFKESLWCNIFLPNNANLLVGVIYRPPNCDPVMTQNMYSLMQQAVKFNSTFKIICGDFNFPLIDWTNMHYPPSMDEFVDILSENDLTQHITSPTREETVLDLVFSSNEELISNVDIIEPLGTSDHHMVWCEMEGKLLLTSDPNSSSSHRQLRDYKFADWVMFQHQLQLVDWNSIFEQDSIDDIWAGFERAINKAISTAVPLKKVKQRLAPLWETRKVQVARQQRNKAERRYLKMKSASNKQKRRNATKTLQQVTQEAIRDFEEKIANNQDTKPFWHYVRSKCKSRVPVGPLISKDDGRLTTTPKECAQVLCKFFSEVFTTESVQNFPFAIPKTTDSLIEINFSVELIEQTLAKARNFASPGPDNIPYIVLKGGGHFLKEQLRRLFQLSFDLGLVPSQWKVAHITPIFKKGNKRDPENYRPVSLTSCTSKLMESCLRTAMLQFWNDRGLLHSSQFGFLPNSSSTLQLLHFLEDVTSFVDAGHFVDTIYLDFSKAFNSVPHERLLCKLSALGIKGKFLTWLRAFLSDRKEIVIVEGVQSEPYVMSSGVPQGSCIGPILFLAFVDDIDDVLQNSIILKYADDIKLYSKLDHHDPTTGSNLLQEDLDSLSEWSDTWNLKFNVKKCSVINFGNLNPKKEYFLKNEEISSNDCERDLGVTISSNLKSSLHVSKIVKDAEKCLAVLKKSFMRRDEKVFLKLYKQIVRPRLEYATAVWNPHYKRDIDLLEKVQRKATKCINGMHDKSYAQRLKLLKLTSLENRRYFFDLVEMFKIVKDLDALNFSHFFNVLSTSTRGHDCRVFKPYARLNVRKFCFSCRVVNAWNSLPNEIVNSASLGAFKLRLRRHLQVLDSSSD